MAGEIRGVRWLLISLALQNLGRRKARSLLLIASVAIVHNLTLVTNNTADFQRVPGLRLDDWLTELISTPVRDYPAFQAALSFLPALPPDDVTELLAERAQYLESELAQAAAARELVEKQGLPRLFWVEAEFGAVLREAELGYVRSLMRDSFRPINGG